MPNALAAVLSDKNSKIEALICPGHVSTITGYGIYTPIVSGLKIPCCISGFEPADILKAIYALVEMHEKSKAALVNAYERAVRPEGNVKARSMMDEVFEPCDVAWRGLGVIPGSGLKIRERYSEFDAEKCFDIAAGETKEDPRCICGDILRGAKEPRECALFGKTCTPELPRGACMVSSEGTCAAWYKYGGS
jgi:hydrogenase expression/formation protein HypD